MDQIFLELFTLSNFVFCVFVWILVWFQRKLVERIWKNAKNNAYWRSFFLPLGPIGTGGILAVITSYPFPEIFATTSSKMIFGAVLGLASAHIYKMFKELFNKKIRDVDETKVITDNEDEDLLA
jgi:uncharacterized membrane protein